MDPGYISPSKLEMARLCEARLAGKLGQIEGESNGDEDRGEGASMGTCAHDAAKLWYRPNEAWLKRVYAGEDYLALARQAQALREKAAAPFQPVPADDPAAVAKADAARRAAVCEADETINRLGLLKHPYSDPDYVFRKGLTDVANGRFGSELPRDAASIDEARELFDVIITHYNRDQLNVVFAERRYKGKIANDVPVHLIIDLGIDRGEGRLEIVDFKTGFITMSTEEMYGKDQVKMNVLAVTNYDQTLAHYPHKSFTYFWVRSGFETGPVSFTREQMLDYEHYLAVTYRHMLSVTEPKESTNRFCASCPRRLNCKAFQSMIGEAMGQFRAATPEEVAALDDEDVMAQWDRLNNQIKLMEGYQKNLKDSLKTRMEKAGQKVIETETFKAAVRQNRADGYDPATVLNLCAVHKVDAASIVGVTKSKVEAAFAANDAAKVVLGQTMRRGCTSPWIDIRQVTAKKPRAKKRPAAEAPAAAGTPPPMPDLGVPPM